MALRATPKAACPKAPRQPTRRALRRRMATFPSGFSSSTKMGPKRFARAFTRMLARMLAWGPPATSTAILAEPAHSRCARAAGGRSSDTGRVGTVFHSGARAHHASPGPACCANSGFLADARPTENMAECIAPRAARKYGAGAVKPALEAVAPAHAVLRMAQAQGVHVRAEPIERIDNLL